MAGCSARIKMTSVFVNQVPIFEKWGLEIKNKGKIKDENTERTLVKGQTLWGKGKQHRVMNERKRAFIFIFVFFEFDLSLPKCNVNFSNLLAGYFYIFSTAKQTIPTSTFKNG